MMESHLWRVMAIIAAYAAIAMVRRRVVVLRCRVEGRADGRELGGDGRRGMGSGVMVGVVER